MKNNKELEKILKMDHEDAKKTLIEIKSNNTVKHMMKTFDLNCDQLYGLFDKFEIPRTKNKKAPIYDINDLMDINEFVKLNFNDAKREIKYITDKYYKKDIAKKWNISLNQLNKIIEKYYNEFDAQNYEVDAQINYGDLFELLKQIEKFKDTNINISININMNIK